ncbi:MAG: helix-turn-helix domain-containing protein [Clostridia bacterium]|nr:helix-turn-helix domain-containing protein [Clostridia bacterium]
MFSFIYQGLEVSHQAVEKPLGSPDAWRKDHCHENCVEIYAFLGGSVRMTVENRQKVLEKGDMAIIMPYAMHHIDVLEDVPYEYMDFKLPSTFISSPVTGKLKNLGPFCKWPEEVPFLDRMDDFYEIYRSEGDSDDMLYLGLSSWMYAILTYLCRRDKPDDAPGTENVLVAGIIKYVDDNISRKITMKTLCDEFHRSPSFIEKQFFKSTGERIMTYVRKRKMDAAEYLITNKSRPSDVARSLGYLDYSSFYKAYVSVKGVPPSGNVHGQLLP